ncbi:DUF2141 domain-containing protein [Paucibacter sp. APW11]|uniref:DUF2141 domain-containing protein n=1 Tax=Roseateles aquae TaxID=3077235 RepID=A0ABU3P8P3_9BURK|nr:DUF2141 domain-containing protein [Paucibacter sp. APW11]MDT8998941.1 DUF2141 domain-containing protein [Paucibacter sp. APW11]
MSRFNANSIRLAAALSALLSVGGVLLPGSAQAAEMELEVSGLTASSGQLMVAVFDQAAQWLGGKPVALARAAASAQQNGRLLLSLKDLPEGEVAFSVFHDVNDNGKLDSNAMGMPTEPYAFSNNATGNFGPASFEQAKFSVKPGVRVSVRLN